MEAEHTEMGRVANDQAAIATVVKLRNFKVTPSIADAYGHLVNQHGEDNKSNRLIEQKKELVAIARQEQINVLQPLIYNDPLLRETMDTNHRFSRLTNGWISPKFKVIYSFSPTNTDPELESVFDAPENSIDRYFGPIGSLPNQEDRMKFVAQIAEKFNSLMKKRPSYMEGELRKIADWVSA